MLREAGRARDSAPGIRSLSLLKSAAIISRLARARLGASRSRLGAARDVRLVRLVRHFPALPLFSNPHLHFFFSRRKRYEAKVPHEPHESHASAFSAKRGVLTPCRLPPLFELP